MKTNVQLFILKNPIALIRRTFIATLMILFTSMALAQNTVVDIIVNSDDHTTLEAAVIAADLAGTLSGEGPFTVFAPTDAALAALPADLLDALLADPSGALTDILLYHVVGSKAMSADLSDGQMITTLNGDSVTVKIMDGKVYIDEAEVILADIETDNGVVHVIDAVLVPSSTVVDVIVGSPVHNTLEAAVIAADLAGTLSGEGPFTVFAPTDAALAALPADLLDALLADPSGALTDILLYHVVGSKAMSADLSDGQMITTLAGSDISVSFADGMVFINDAQVTVADIETDNGVVHVIDAVLTPSTGVNERIMDTENVSVYPNPAREYFNIRYELVNASEIRLEMYDMVGQRVRIQEEGYAFEGTYDVRMSVDDLQAGMYIVILNTGNSKVANKVRVVK